MRPPNQKILYCLVGVVLLTEYSFNLSKFSSKLIKNEIREEVDMNGVNGRKVMKNSTYVYTSTYENATAMENVQEMQGIMGTHEEADDSGMINATNTYIKDTDRNATAMGKVRGVHKVTGTTTKEKMQAAKNSLVVHNAKQKEEEGLKKIVNEGNETHNNTDLDRDVETKIIKEQHTKKIAYTIAITKDGNHVIDMAAVLAQSIKKNHRGIFDYDLVALVHESAISTIPKLKLIGFNTTVVSTPLDVSMIQDQSYAQIMTRSGCCGEKEFIKLHTFRMFNYTRVVYFDADALLIKPLTKFLNMNKSLVYTYDYGNIGQHRNRKACVQGGFFIAKPSQKTFENIVDVVLEGNYTKRNGWRHSRAGSCFGGETIQGIFSYYVKYMAAPQDVYEANFCTVNDIDAAMNGTNFDCQMVDPKTVISFHFPNQKKPWKCNKFPPQNKNLPIFRKIWWTLRNEMEMERNWTIIPSQEGCMNGTYKPIEYNSIGMLENLDKIPIVSNI